MIKEHSAEIRLLGTKEEAWKIFNIVTEIDYQSKFCAKPCNTFHRSSGFTIQDYKIEIVGPAQSIIDITAKMVKEKYNIQITHVLPIKTCADH